MEVPHNYNELIQYLFYGIICLISGSAVRVLIAMNKSIEELNTKVITMIERSNWHEKQIDELKRDFKQIRSLKPRIIQGDI